MRILIPLLLSSAVMMTACTTTTAPPETLPVAQASSSQCINNLDWAAAAKRGASLFNSSCAYCHQKTGEGQAGQVPALANNSGLAADPDRGIRLLIVTKSQTSRTHGMEYDDMTAIFGELNNGDLADLMTYVLSSWGNCAGPISVSHIDHVAASM